jgi:small conductance mechanosensitive channel
VRAVIVASVLRAQGSDVDELQESATGAWTTILESLPRVGIAMGVLVAFIVTGRLLRPVVRRRLIRHRTPSFARVFAKLTSSAMTVAGVLLGLTIVFPSVRPVDVLTGAGVLTIAAGFAFQDILQNLLAGVLLLFRQPFRGGDQIRVGDVTGTVEEINIRETVIITFDGRRILIPNAKVYTDVIHVQTAHQTIRSNFVVGVAYEADMAAARTIATEAVARVEGVVADPPPEALYLELESSTVNLDIRFWSDAHQLELRRTLDRAIEAVKTAFDAHGIEMPSQVIALQATSSLAAALRGGEVTPGGSVANGQRSSTHHPDRSSPS